VFDKIGKIRKKGEKSTRKRSKYIHSYFLRKPWTLQYTMGRRNKRKNKKEKKAAKKMETETKMSSSERSGSREDFSTVDRLESFQPGPSSSHYTRTMEQVYQPHPAMRCEVNIFPFP
jgi:hypothetical protein